MSWKTTLFTSLDNRVDASGDWQFPWFEQEYFGVLSRTWSDADGLLVGATSFKGYENLVAHFPDSPMVSLLRSKPLYVASKTRTDSPQYPDAVWLSDLSAPVLDDLAARHPDIVIPGSPALVVALLERNALHQLNLAVLPVVQGEGRGLYDTATRPITFSRSEARSLPNGITLLDFYV